MPVNVNSQASIDTFNAQLRGNPEYQAFLRSMGANPSGPLNLSDQQRKMAASWVRNKYGAVGNLEIDPAGNLNQDEGFSRHKKWMIPAAIGAGTLGLGAAGIGPAAGLFGAGGGAGAGAAGGAASGVLPSSALPVSSLMGGPAAASAGLSGVGAAGVPAYVTAGTSAALGGVTPRGVEQASRGLSDRLLDNLLSPEGLLTAGSIAAQLATGGDGTNDQTRATEDQARRLQAITEARMRRVDPLHEAVTQLAFSRLPVSSRQSINLPRIALPE
jgi:hypothetical protein